MHEIVYTYTKGALLVCMIGVWPGDQAIALQYWMALSTEAKW